MPEILQNNGEIVPDDVRAELEEILALAVEASENSSALNWEGVNTKKDIFNITFKGKFVIQNVIGGWVFFKDSEDTNYSASAYSGEIVVTKS